MKYICIWLIRFYRKFLSPLKRQSCCRFVPTCSAYALEAFQKRGFFVGMILTVWRVLRCNPYCAGGYDPVPETGLRYKGPREIPTPEDCFGCDQDDRVSDDPCRKDDGRGRRQEAGDAYSASCKEDGGIADRSSVHGKDQNQ